MREQHFLWESGKCELSIPAPQRRLDAKPEAKHRIDQQQIPKAARGGFWDLTETARRLK